MNSNMEMRQSEQEHLKLVDDLIKGEWEKLGLEIEESLDERLLKHIIRESAVLYKQKHFPT